MNRYFLLILALPVAGLAQPTCPTESMIIEYVSPVSHTKVAFCGYIKNGSTIKHGEEWLYDRNGQVVKKKNFLNGEEKEGVEEASKVIVDGLLLQKKAIRDLVSVLAFKKSFEKGEFKVNKCDDKPKSWAVAAFMKSKLNKSYQFNEYCDVNGSFVANFSEPFPMQFALRHLQDYNDVKMQVKMTLNQSKKGIHYQFEVLEGSLSAPSRKVMFKAQYEVEIDIQTGNAYPDTQKGSMTITEADGKPVNETSELTFPYQ